MKHSKATIDAARRAIAADEPWQPEALFDGGADVYDACTNTTRSTWCRCCHRTR